MTTILVPAPPKSAFNKNRPVSDLLLGQLKHFAHVEASLPSALRSNMTKRDYLTEEGAAKYIAHLTNVLKSLKQVKAPTLIRATAKVSQGLALAAATETTKATPKSKAKATKKAPKRSGRKA